MTRALPLIAQITIFDDSLECEDSFNKKKTERIETLASLTIHDEVSPLNITGVQRRRNALKSIRNSYVPCTQTCI